MSSHFFVYWARFALVTSWNSCVATFPETLKAIYKNQNSIVAHWIQVTLRIRNTRIRLSPEATVLRQPHLQIIAARKSTQMCSVVPRYTKDHLKSIILLLPDWPGNDTTQMILGIMVHRQRVTSSSLRWCPPPKNLNQMLPPQSEI